ncbi:MAG: 50S ribosomal protein L3 [Candidatus Atribacteria bacterium]|nr:50S ribosomal protein L3 [Candidatus Atribacteria bacterium]
MKFIIGKKIGMSQIFQDNKVIPVTLIEAIPGTIIGERTIDKDGYEAVRIGFDKKGENRYRYQRELRGSGLNDQKIGDSITVKDFVMGDRLKITGNSKGKGFQGVVKRWNFAGRNATHGGKGQIRRGGSVGSMFPQRVIKGRKMPGRMGDAQISLKNVLLVKIEEDDNLLVVKGGIPGRNGTLLKIKG